MSWWGCRQVCDFEFRSARYACLESGSRCGVSDVLLLVGGWICTDFCDDVLRGFMISGTFVFGYRAMEGVGWVGGGISVFCDYLGLAENLWVGWKVSFFGSYVFVGLEFVGCCGLWYRRCFLLCDSGFIGFGYNFDFGVSFLPRIWL